jgi:hypothetical protein
MDFDNPIKLQDYHPDALSRPIIGVHLATENLATSNRQVHGIAFENAIRTLGSHLSQRVIYFMDPKGRNTQGELFLEYSNETLQTWVSDVITFFTDSPWNRKPVDMTRAQFLLQQLPVPGEPRKYEDKQHLKDILTKAAKALANDTPDHGSTAKLGIKRPREESPLLSAGNERRPNAGPKFPYGLDLAAVRTTDAEGKIVCRQHAVGGKGCTRGSSCAYSHALQWTQLEMDRARRSAINKGDHEATEKTSKKALV